jgi:hypothetical protein
MGHESAALQSQILLDLIAWPVSVTTQYATVVFIGFIGLIAMQTPMKLRHGLTWIG